MKRFYVLSLDRNIPPMLRKVRGTYQLRGRQQEQVEVVKAERLAARLLDACRTYYRFAYTEAPAAGDYASLEAARDAMLAVMHALNRPLTATTHYMTNHFVEFARLDGSAYHTLQEGAESHHQDDRRSARTIFMTPLDRLNSREPMQQLLEQQELQRILLRRGHCPPSRKDVLQAVEAQMLRRSKRATNGT